MSTTYYVRTYNCSFPTKAADCTSRNQVLNFLTASTGTLEVPTNLFSNFSQPFYGSSGIFYLCDPSNGTRNTVKGSYNNGSYGGYKAVYSGSSAIKSSILSTSNYIGLEKTYWNTWGGYTSGTLATFKTELCNQFQNSKSFNELSAIQDWGTDAGQINMILFSCTFDDDAGKIYYFPIFYMGNDPQADETIVI